MICGLHIIPFESTFTLSAHQNLHICISVELQQPVKLTNKSTVSSQTSGSVFGNHCLFFKIYLKKFVPSQLKHFKMCFSFTAASIEVKSKDKMYIVIYRNIRLSVLHVRERDVCMWHSHIFNRSFETVTVYMWCFALSSIRDDQWSVCDLFCYKLRICRACGFYLSSRWKEKDLRLSRCLFKIHLRR